MQKINIKVYNENIIEAKKYIVKLQFQTCPIILDLKVILRTSSRKIISNIDNQNKK